LYTALDFYVDSIGARIACLYRDGMRGMINTNTVAFVDFNFFSGCLFGSCSESELSSVRFIRYFLWRADSSIARNTLAESKVRIVTGKN